MARQVGDSWAEQLGDLNEIKGDLLHKQERGEQRMDLHNNKCGRKKGKKAKDKKDCQKGCEEGLSNGELITEYTPGTTPNIWQFTFGGMW
jgi:hypothetical protein